MKLLHWMRAAGLLVVLCGMAAGELQRIEIRGRDEMGPYERIVGTAYFSI